MQFPLPDNESERLRALARYDLLDTPPEASFDRITELAAKIFEVPIALVSLVDSDRQWFKSKHGVSICETSRDVSFCTHTILDDAGLIVPDATADVRFADNPLVTGETAIRFYAGAPLVTSDGYRLGSLCLIDTVPRPFSEVQLATLKDLASIVVESFEARRANTTLAAEINERQEADRALRKAEARKAAIFNAALDGIITIDHEGKILEFNPAAEKMFGFSESRAVGCEMADLIIPPAYRAAHRRGMAHFLTTGEGPILNKRLELTAQHTDGSEFPVELIMSRIASDGPPVFTGYVRDLTERRQAESRLRMLESAVTNANDAIIITEAVPQDKPGPRIVYVNKAFTDITGYSSEEAIGKTPRILQGPNTSPDARRQIKQAMEACQPIRTELLNNRKDGSEFWIEMNIVPVLDAKGVYTHCVSVQRETTERRRIEQALKTALTEAEGAAARLRTVLESISDAFFSLDREWRFTYLNAQGERLLQRGWAELIGRNVWEEFPEAVGGVFDLEYRRAVASGQPARFESFYEPLAIWLQVNAYPSSEGLSVYFTDITARKRAQQELEDSNRLLRAVIDGTDNIIFIKDRESRYVLINPAGAAILGRTPEEVVGKDDTAFFSLENASAIQAFDREIMLADSSSTYESADTIAGVEHVFVSTKSPYHDAAGNLLGVIGIVREITAQRRAMEAEYRAMKEAEKANAAKSEFLSRMSHELRTPLNAILGFGQLLEMGNLQGRQLESVGHILKAGRHLLTLIDEVLAISRIEAGKIDLSLEPVGLSSLLGECLSLVSVQAEERGVRFRDAVSEDPRCRQLYVLADQQRLRQVLLNLFSNAIKYNRPRGKVTVICRETVPGDGQTNPTVRLEVTDTGQGLSGEEITRLFTPFERLNAAKTKVEGTGLGLALSKALVEAMHGSIGVESVPHEGSTFWVELPVAEAPANSRGGDGPRLEFTGSTDDHAATILYVEDNLSNLRLIEMLLAGWPNIRLLSAEQGTLGLELARVSRPDLILLDLHLPDLPGWEVLDQLQGDERTRHIPTVIISADATAGRIERLMAAGASAYLTKPINVQELMRMIRLHMEPVGLPSR